MIDKEKLIKFFDDEREAIYGNMINAAQKSCYDVAFGERQKLLWLNEFYGKIEHGDFDAGEQLCDSSHVEVGDIRIYKGMNLPFVVTMISDDGDACVVFYNGETDMKKAEAFENDELFARCHTKECGTRNLFEMYNSKNNGWVLPEGWEEE